VNVQVENSLTTGRPMVDTDVVAIRMVLVIKQGLGPIEGWQQGLLFFRRGLKQRGDMALRDDQDMAR
jgi:hypothetical protein